MGKSRGAGKGEKVNLKATHVNCWERAALKPHLIQRFDGDGRLKSRLSCHADPSSLRYLADDPAGFALVGKEPEQGFQPVTRNGNEQPA